MRGGAAAGRAAAPFPRDRDTPRPPKPSPPPANISPGSRRRGRSIRRRVRGGLREISRAGTAARPCAAASPSARRIAALHSLPPRPCRADRVARRRSQACRAAPAGPAVRPKRRTRPCPRAEWALRPRAARPFRAWRESEPVSAWHSSSRKRWANKCRRSLYCDQSDNGENVVSCLSRVARGAARKGRDRFPPDRARSPTSRQAAILHKRRHALGRSYGQAR